jgi:hypothetical protein
MNFMVACCSPALPQHVFGLTLGAPSKLGIVERVDDVQRFEVSRCWVYFGIWVTLP